MTTTVQTLSDFAETLTELAEEWDGEEPVVLVGDRTGSVNVMAKDGFTKHGCVGYAQECFERNGVHTLGQSDTRFFGTMLVRREDLSEDAREQLDEVAKDGDES